MFNKFVFAIGPKNILKNNLILGGFRADMSHTLPLQAT